MIQSMTYITSSKVLLQIVLKDDAFQFLGGWGGGEEVCHLRKVSCS